MKLDYTPPTILTANMITRILCNHTMQLAIGNLLRDSKLLINQLYQFRATCSYDEVLPFKKSAACAPTKETQLSGIYGGKHGLIQTVADNFDTDISLHNGNITTHALPMIIAQPNHDGNREAVVRIPRILQVELSNY